MTGHVWRRLALLSLVGCVEPKRFNVPQQQGTDGGEMSATSDAADAQSVPDGALSVDAATRVDAPPSPDVPIPPDVAIPIDAPPPDVIECHGGQPCDSGSPCKTGLISCATGAPVCVLSNVAENTPCGAITCTGGTRKMRLCRQGACSDVTTQCRGQCAGAECAACGADGQPCCTGNSCDGALGCGPNARCRPPCTVRCETPDTLLTCPNGLEARTGCLNGCNSATLACNAICRPGSFTCFSESSVHACNASGTAYDFPVGCSTVDPAKPVCADGQCRKCRPGATRCDSQSQQTCLPDGSAWGAGQDCRLALHGIACLNLPTFGACCGGPGQICCFSPACQPDLHCTDSAIVDGVPQGTCQSP